MHYHLRQSGDTLVEVVMSIAILALTLVTTYNIANTAFSAGIQAREQTQAVYLAQDQAEKLRYYRDYLVAQDPDELVSTNIMSAANFSSCNGGGGCYVDIAGNGTPTLNSGQLPAAQSDLFNGVQYNVSIGPLSGSNAVGASVPTGEGQFKVTVTWDSTFGTGITIGTAKNQNITTLNVILADPRGINPRDCSVVGSATCA
jgi:Tfp pilus assembly protein PilV